MFSGTFLFTMTVCCGLCPGSHIRINTEEENRQLLADPRLPLPGSVQTHLNGGDGVVYITPILHWGSNYSAKLRAHHSRRFLQLHTI